MSHRRPAAQGWTFSRCPSASVTAPTGSTTPTAASATAPPTTRPGERSHARRHLCTGLHRAPGAPADDRQPARGLEGRAEEAGHELTAEHVFRDEGHSGARLDRPGLDALRDAVRDAEVDIVAVLSPDRLARRYAYQVLILEEFRRAGCEVMFLNHSISDNPGDQLLLDIQGAVAEYERALLGERFRRGKLQKARAGWFIGGRAPYGYRYLPCRYGAGGRLGSTRPKRSSSGRSTAGWPTSG